jgi:phage host-nuclease inhibitor protein Gam
MTKTIEEMNSQIKAIKEQIESLLDDLYSLTEERDRAESAKNVAELNITRDEVQLGAAPGVHHRDVYSLLSWIKESGRGHKYYEWNGHVYRVEDGPNPVLMRKPICSYEDLPE